jgi:hypothetical protein
MRLTCHFVVLAVVVVACGEPVADRSTTIPAAVETTVTTSPPPTTSTPATSSTVAPATTSPVDVDEMSPDELVGLLDSMGRSVVRPNLVAGQVIDPPADFPSVEDLAVSADGFFNPGMREP